MNETHQDISRLRDEIRKAIVGKPEAIDLLLTALLAGGHVLIEDLPGLGKTTLARALAKAPHANFARIQFTPDLMPADIVGTSVYRQSSGEFVWRPGPVFSNVLLADEINRATPRTQAALLEAMSEAQVSADGETRKLPDPFMVIATQNPIEHAGTYPLPESQLDRFMLRMSLGYPGIDHEREILSRFANHDPVDEVGVVLSSGQLGRAKASVQNVRVDDSLKNYILAIVTETRSHSRLIAGASPRGSLALYRASQAFGFLKGRDYVVPDDIKTVAVAVLSHRVIERAAIDSRGSQTPGQSTLTRIVEKIPVPV